MKKMFLLIALLALLSSVAVAEDGGGSYIGAFWDEAATTCSATLTQYVPTNLYIYAVVNTAVIDGITAAEFQIIGMPADAGYPDGGYSVEWETPLVIGGINDPGGEPSDIAVSFQEPQIPAQATGGIPMVVLLGTIEFMSYSTTWPEADTRVEFIPTSDGEKLALVDSSYVPFTVGGGWFYINGEGDCPNTATEETSWSEIKSLY